MNSGSLSSTIPPNAGQRAGRSGGGVLCQMTFILLNDSDQEGLLLVQASQSGQK